MGKLWTPQKKRLQRAHGTNTSSALVLAFRLWLQLAGRLPSAVQLVVVLQLREVLQLVVLQLVAARVGEIPLTSGRQTVASETRWRLLLHL